MRTGILFFSDALRAQYGHAILAFYHTNADPSDSDYVQASQAFGNMSVHVLTGVLLRAGSQMRMESKALPIEDQVKVLKHFKTLHDQLLAEEIRYRSSFDVHVIDNLLAGDIVSGYRLAKRVDDGFVSLICEQAIYPPEFVDCGDQMRWQVPVFQEARGHLEEIEVKHAQPPNLSTHQEGAP